MLFFLLFYIFLHQSEIQYIAKIIFFTLTYFYILGVFLPYVFFRKIGSTPWSTANYVNIQ